MRYFFSLKNIFLIHSQQGYGKTSFIKEILKDYSEKENVLCIYLFEKEDKIKKDESLFIFLSNLLYNLRGEFFSFQKEEEYVKNIFDAAVAAAIKKKKNERKEVQIIVIIDSACLELNEFITFLQKYFIPYSQNAKREIRFIFIISVNSGFKNSLIEYRGIKWLTLKPLYFNEVYLLVDKYIDSGENEILRNIRCEIAAHVLFFTGGHPKCIAEILTENKESILNRTIIFSVKNPKNRKRCNDVLIEIAVKINELLACELHLKDTVLFGAARYIDKIVIQKYFNIDKADADLIFYRLTSEYLINFKEGLYCNDIIRSILAAHARLAFPHIFCSTCQKVGELCRELLDSQSSGSREKLVVEYLFQILQEISIDSSKKIGFFHEKLIFILETYLSKIDIIEYKDKEGLIIETIFHDEEFCFLLNYLFNDQEYNNENATNQLKENISIFFTGKTMKHKVSNKYQKVQSQTDKNPMQEWSKRFLATFEAHTKSIAFVFGFCFVTIILIFQFLFLSQQLFNIPCFVSLLP